MSSKCKSEINKLNSEIEKLKTQLSKTTLQTTQMLKQMPSYLSLTDIKLIKGRFLAFEKCFEKELLGWLYSNEKPLF